MLSCGENIKISKEEILLIKEKYYNFSFYGEKKEYEVLEKDLKIGSINFKKIYANRYGVFFQVKSSFVEEYGFFVPKEGYEVKSGKGQDPEYIYLDHDVYIYKIRG